MTGLAARPFRRSGPAVAGCWWWWGCRAPAQQPRRPRPDSCATSRSVPRRSARQPARPAGSSQGPPDSPAAGSAAADGVEVEVAGSAAADVGGSTDVGGRVVAGGSAVVRVGRVVGVAVSLGDSVTLGAGRVPERWSRYGSTKCCHQVLQLPSSRASPIGASPPDPTGSWGPCPGVGAPIVRRGPPAASPEAGENPVPHRAPLRAPGQAELTPMWHGT
jgi:hypothetical protein